MMKKKKKQKGKSKKKVCVFLYGISPVEMESK